MSYFRSARGIGKHIYPIRTIGYLFGAFTLCIYRYQIESISWLTYVITAVFLIYPHIAFYDYQRRDCDSRLEIRYLTFDGLLVGIFSAHMHFALLPMTSYFVVVAATSMGVKGPKLFIAYLSTFITGALLVGFTTGFVYENAPSLSVQLLSIGYLVVGTVSHNFIDYQRSLKFIEAKEQINQQKLQIELSLQEKELLLKEIHHRVKNNLQIITSLLNLQAEHINDKAALNAIKSCKGRVKSMSTVHEILYQNDNLKDINIADYIPRLANHIKQLYQISLKKIDLAYDIAPVTIDLKTAIPLGLIINEIISNSCKYAFKEQSSGLIKISALLKDHSLELLISDNGCGFDKQDYQQAARTNSLGMQLVGDMLKQLKATGSIRTSNGTTHSLLIPMLS
ncbi:histidine kinase dimerization/phosphoacceptor domain -containing protein [Gracilimonas sp.]|uniref:histidine kinase dimerization/phosphoacceptor domain -containing protein n=1 Tax=Gracilimonas sp. TaxID=1974203 RepID=UPI003BACBB44